MRTLEDLYTNRFFKIRDRRLSWRAPIFVSAVCDVLHPISIIDAGAGIGDLVREFNHRDIPAVGIEGSKRAEPYLVCDSRMIRFRDLRKPLDLNIRSDLCLCIEVAEHIEEEYDDIFLDNITGFSKRLLISICNDGPGTGHVNLKPMEYWDEKLSLRGFYPNEEISKEIIERIYPHKEKSWIQMIIDRLHYYEEKE